MSEDIVEIESQPNRGFERFTSSKVTITNEVVPFDFDSLDRVGKKTVTRWGVQDYVAIRGLARIQWGSPEDRKMNIDYQSKKRWQEVQRFAQLMRNGQWDFDQQGAVFIYGPRLKPVDGARRIMAAIEAELSVFDVVVLRGR